jgi:hypothetical protein
VTQFSQWFTTFEGATGAGTAAAAFRTGVEVPGQYDAPTARLTLNPNPKP